MAYLKYNCFLKQNHRHCFICGVYYENIWTVWNVHWTWSVMNLWVNPIYLSKLVHCLSEILAYCLFSAKPLSQPMVAYWIPIFFLTLNKTFIKNGISKVAAVLPWPQCFEVHSFYIQESNGKVKFLLNTTENHRVKTVARFKKQPSIKTNKQCRLTIS